eukprot:scaffold2795_cov106-Isochrysis_galbana.AAC.13
MVRERPPAEQRQEPLVQHGRRRLGPVARGAGLDRVQPEDAHPQGRGADTLGRQLVQYQCGANGATAGDGAPPAAAAAAAAAVAAAAAMDAAAVTVGDATSAGWCQRWTARSTASSPPPLAGAARAARPTRPACAESRRPPRCPPTGSRAAARRGSTALAPRAPSGPTDAPRERPPGAWPHSPEPLLLAGAAQHRSRLQRRVRSCRRHRRDTALRVRAPARRTARGRSGSPTAVAARACRGRLRPPALHK